MIVLHGTRQIQTELETQILNAVEVGQSPLSATGISYRVKLQVTVEEIKAVADKLSAGPLLNKDTEGNYSR